MTAAITPFDRGDAAYELARSYLLGFAHLGITESLLATYLNPGVRLAPHDLCGVYRRLVESAQNAGMMATVIGKSVGGVTSLKSILCDFDPGQVLASYPSAEELLDTIVAEANPRGKVRRGEASGPASPRRLSRARAFSRSSRMSPTSRGGSPRFMTTHAAAQLCPSSSAVNCMALGSH